MSILVSIAGDKLVSATPWFTATPGAIGLWIKPTSIGTGTHIAEVNNAASDGFILGTDSGGSGNASFRTRQANSEVQAISSAALSTSIWQFICGGSSGPTFRQCTTGIGNKGTSGSSKTPASINAVTCFMRSDGTFTYRGEASHLLAFTAIPSDVEISALGRGVNPRAFANLIAGYELHASGGTQSDFVGSNTLTATGTTTGADDPVLGTWWTAAAQGNVAYTQGTPIPSIDLATKFVNVNSPFTCSVRQLGSPGTPSAASATVSNSTLITVASAAAFAINSYCSVTNNSTPTLILDISGNTLLLAIARSWTAGDNVYPISHSAKTFTGLSVNGSNLWQGTPAAGDVGTYSNLIFWAVNNTTNTLVAASAPFTATIASSGAAPSFSAGPTLTSANTDGYTFGATSNQTATLHLGIYIKGSATPSVANVKAGAGTGFVSHFTAALTLNIANSISATGLTLPVYDAYLVLSNGSGDSALSSFTNQQKAPPNGFQYQQATMVSISAITKAVNAQVTATGHGYITGDTAEIFGVGGMTQINGITDTITFVDANNFTLNNTNSTAFSNYTTGGTVTRGQSCAYNASTVIASGDIFVVPTSTPKGYAISVAADGVLSITASSDLSRQTALVDCYSVSLGALIGSATAYVNNQGPVAPQNSTFIRGIFLPLNVPASVSIAGLAADAENDFLIATTGSAYPAGLSAALTGTPTVAAITTMNWTWTDPANDSDTGPLNVVTGNVPVPNLVGLTQQDADAVLLGVYLTATYGNQDNAAALGTVIASTPVAGAPAVPNTPINVTLSTGIVPAVNVSVPDVSSSPITQAAAVATILAANLVPQVPQPWTGSVRVTQSPVALSQVPQGSLVYLSLLGGAPTQRRRPMPKRGAPPPPPKPRPRVIIRVPKR